MSNTLSALPIAPSSICAISANPSLYSLSRPELEAQILALGEKAFRAKQVCEWLFEKRMPHVDLMSNIPKSLREKIKEAWDTTLPEIKDRVDAEDGATKLLLKTQDGKIMETVILRYDGRTSLCVSSQVGCKMSCSFCQTGKLGFFKHLSTGEIMSQFLIAQDLIRGEGRQITHVVFMGMGEPLDNFDHAVKACSLLTGPQEYGISARRVTLSTSGIVPKIMPLAKACRVSLAISLHAATDDLRSELMPINRKYPLPQLKQALLAYQEFTGDMITIEYILIRDKNCGLKQAKDLVKYLHGLRAKVNLIPFNAHPGLDYQRPSTEDITQFQQYLSERGYPAPVRYSKGLEVSAACGQLAAKHTDNLHKKPERRDVMTSAMVQAPSV